LGTLEFPTPFRTFIVPWWKVKRMATRRRLAILKGQWPEKDASMAVELLPFSQFVDNVTQKRSPEDEWRQHHDPALEVAITRKTLQRLVLYHGSLVKVFLMHLHVMQDVSSKFRLSDMWTGELPIIMLFD